jgi:hypothetical protein
MNIHSVHIRLNFIYQTPICRQFKKSHTNHHSTFPGVRAMMFYTTCNNISAILWRSVLIGGGNRRKPPRKSLTNFITLCRIEYISPWTGFELTTLVVISTDSTCSCKSNNHMTTTTPLHFYYSLMIKQVKTWKK